MESQLVSAGEPQADAAGLALKTDTEAPGSRAYITFLAGSGSGYLKGVVALAKGLRKVKSSYPLIVAVLPDVPAEHHEILESQGCIVREIEPIHPPENNGYEYIRPYYIVNYSKLRIWKFEEYKKLLYLDGDIQVFQNIDHLFDLPDGYLYAVTGCSCEPTWSKRPHYKVGYCQQSPEKVHWPVEQLGPKPPPYYNAGFIVFEPNVQIYNDLLNTLKITPPNSFAEQDFLNMFFEGKFKPLSIDYNLMLAFLWRHPEKVNLEKVNVVHYCVIGAKPWSYTGNEENMDRDDIRLLVKRWWDIYNDESLDLKRPNPICLMTNGVAPVVTNGVN